FWYIAINNIRVSFAVFMFGLFWGIGSLIDILWEAIRLACFLFFFISRDLGFNALTSIFMHGAIEISSLIITGGAGFIMGKGLLFPGNYGRFQSFQMSAKRGIKIILSLIPFFLFAAFIEGYITRLTDIHPLFRLAFVVLCFVFIGFYFFIYPRFVVRKTQAIKYLNPEKLQSIVKETPNKYGIMKSDEIYNNAITFLLNKSAKFLLYAAVISALLSLTLYYFEKQLILSNIQLGMGRDFGAAFVWPFERISFLFNHYKNHFLPAYSIFVLGISLIFNNIHKGEFKKEDLYTYLNIIVVTLIFTGLMMFKTGYFGFFFVFSSLYCIAAYIIVTERKNAFSAVLDCLSAIKENFGLYIGVNLVFLFVSIVFLLMTFSPLWIYFTWFTGFMFEESETNNLQYYMFTFFVYLFALYALFIIYSCNVYLYETLKEIKGAYKVKELIKKLSPIRR
ncbi:MAG TPA: stage II sporulation protein M, partial [Cytophagales bacterium]|nr:stage II sporulation protein M [Cytophagales bacterium]